MKPVFLSHPINTTTPLYGGQGQIVITADRCLAAGDTCNSAKISFPNHSGTHVDAPRHFLETGRNLSDFREQEWFFKKPFLLDLKVQPREIINPLVSMVCGPEVEFTDLLLIRTGFEKYRCTELYWKEGPGLSSDLADEVQKKMPHLRAIGIDFISVSSYQNREMGRKAHRSLLGLDLLLIEDMKLSVLEKSPQEVIVAPLLLEGLDGGPVTVFAMV